ncbi:MAG: FAD-binding protein [Chloroflexi bacterium]|nr:FAD-binding protein [Chloroflexota bacterium]
MKVGLTSFSTKDRRLMAVEMGTDLRVELLRELEGIVGRERVLTSPEDMICYGYDATWLEGRPDAVVNAVTTQEVSSVLKLANRERIPVIPRGAGSGLSAGSIPSRGGIILNLALMNRILEIDTENLIAVVETGVITATLQDEVERLGLFYPPDPSSIKQSTIGGNIAECAGGPRCLKYGTTKDYVLGLEVVLPTGGIIRTGGKAIKNVTGYNLNQLFTGSEGTLGVITEATLRLIPLPKEKRTVMAVFPRIEDASTAVTGIIAAAILPATLEIMDDTTIRLVETNLRIGLPLDAEAVLLIDVDSDPEVLDRHVAEIAATCRASRASEVKVATNAAESDALWRGRRSITGSFGRIRPSKVNEDVVVPRSEIPALVRKIKEIARKYDLIIAIFGHAGDGNLHPNILFDRRNTSEEEKVHQAATEIFEAAVSLGGTLSGEHGIGVSKREFLNMALSPEVIAVMKTIKHVCDPNGILNPDKIFPNS